MVAVAAAVSEAVEGQTVLELEVLAVGRAAIADTIEVFRCGRGLKTGDRRALVAGVVVHLLVSQGSTSELALADVVLIRATPCFPPRKMTQLDQT